MTGIPGVLSRALTGLNNVVNDRPQGERSVAPGRYATLSPSVHRYQQMQIEAEARRAEASSMH